MQGQTGKRSSLSIKLLVACTAMALCTVGCQRRHDTGPVTLRYFRLGWSQPDELPTAEPLTVQFERETGIHLKNLPVPETSLEQLNLSRNLLKTGDKGPDVLGIDIIWLGTLQQEIIDLRPYLSGELDALSPQLLRAYTVNGKLLAVPYAAQTGVLEYRTDLLRKYGYMSPPRTWDELEAMATKIQTGERRAGNKSFWGYVWQGAPAESLTCNGLEWQAAEGAGRIIENDRTISVNNPATLRAWERAKHWIGTISPPGVVFYRESDSSNAFDAGNAAFNRVWGGAPITRSGQSSQMHWRSSLSQERTGYSIIPGGPDGDAAALGGSGLGIAKASAHQKEAIELVRYLLRAQIRANQADERGRQGTPEINGRPLLSESIRAEESETKTAGGIISRPSNLAGARYEQVSRAYIAALHSVLVSDQPAPEALSALEKQLVAITGFKVSSSFDKSTNATTVSSSR